MVGENGERKRADVMVRGVENKREREREGEHDLRHLPPGVLNHYLTHANLLSSQSNTHTNTLYQDFFFKLANGESKQHF